ncbi:hypothetical protein QJS10_CPB15g01301 [Acorus calamus]|uniref:DUF4220 domain-containing protein n=1 Tax=Acorus calamus TaxID=4465 RepID=A0AAV9D9R4_ACOCL|nr:hypothetical protein QJS10_CPB15g01301 [Acorus calamus]
MFLVGFLKYGERTWSLMSARMDHLSKTMSPPEVDPDYIKFREMYTIKEDAGLPVDLVVEDDMTQAVLFNDDDNDDNEGTRYRWHFKEYWMILTNAHDLYQTFKRLIVDLTLTFPDLHRSQSILVKLNAEQAFRLVEIELSLIYEMLYIKAPVIHSTIGPYLRLFTFTSILTSFVLFIFTNKTHYREADVILTYVLSVGGLFLETVSIVLLISSDQALVKMEGLTCYKNLALPRLIISVFQILPDNLNKRWSGSMAQCNLILFWLSDKKWRRHGKKYAWLGEIVYEKLRPMNVIVPIDPKLKAFIFKELKTKLRTVDDWKDHKRSGHIRYAETCTEASWYFSGENINNNLLDWDVVCERLVKAPTSGRRGVTRDWSKSVLLDACNLAQSLNKEKEKWEIISAVWAEMLCHAASQCRGYRHAQRLSKGGEFLSFVWLLMAHLGIGDMYHREAKRVKLIIEK